MSLPFLLFVNLRRNLLRSMLTGGAVMVALFLYCFLAGVLDTFDAAVQVGSESRLVTRNAIAIIFPLPLPYRDRIKALPGVQEVTTANWFGALDPADPKGFFAQFGVDGESYFPMYSKEMQIVEGDAAPAGTPVPQGNDPKLAAYYADLRGAVVGDKLMEKKGWKLGQTVTLQGTIWPGDHTFNIRAVYHPTDRSFGDEQFLFHWKYQDQISQAVGMGALQAGWYTISLKDPSMAAAVAQAVDAMFETSADRSKTETERAMQAGFISMWGNVPFLIRVIGLAVVFAILGVAANAMMITFRERTAEIGILKTLGFSDGTVFGLVLAEAAILTLGGGAIGAYGAKYLVESTGFNAGGMLPPMSVYTSTVVQGLLIAAALGALSGIVPATLALRLRIVDALRRA